jgi:hypothetical protein
MSYTSQLETLPLTDASSIGSRANNNAGVVALCAGILHALSAQHHAAVQTFGR